jgi:hypothetical protein
MLIILFNFQNFIEILPLYSKKNFTPQITKNSSQYFMGSIHLIVSIEFFIISSNLTINRTIYFRRCSLINWDAGVKYSDAIAKYESQNTTLIFSFGNVAFLNFRPF